MSKYWSKIAAGQRPYVPGEQPKDKKYIKLNTNECPYPPSPLVLKAIKEAANEKLKLYPDPNGEDLRQTVAEYYGLKKEWVFVGNGSDEILAFAFMAFLTRAARSFSRMLPIVSTRSIPICFSWTTVWFRCGKNFLYTRLISTIPKAASFFQTPMPLPATM